MAVVGWWRLCQGFAWCCIHNSNLKFWVEAGVPPKNIQKTNLRVKADGTTPKSLLSGLKLLLTAGLVFFVLYHSKQNKVTRAQHSLILNGSVIGRPAFCLKSAVNWGPSDSGHIYQEESTGLSSRDPGRSVNPFVIPYADPSCCIPQRFS